MILTYKKKIKILKIFLITFIALTSNAMEFCFKKGPSIHQTRLEIKNYLVAGESIKILPKSHCLQLKVKPLRHDFISKIIHSHFRKELEITTKPTFQSEFCKFKLKEETTIEGKKSESISELIATSGDGFDLELGESLLEMTCHKKMDSYLVDFVKKNERRDLVNLKLERGKWFDLSSFSNLKGKNYSLMVIE